MRNPALARMRRGVLCWGGVSEGVSYACAVLPQLLREPSNRLGLRLIQRVRVDLLKKRLLRLDSIEAKMLLHVADMLVKKKEAKK